MTWLRFYGYFAFITGLIAGAISAFVKLNVGADQIFQTTLLGLIAIAVDDIRKRGEK